MLVLAMGFESREQIIIETTEAALYSLIKMSSFKVAERKVLSLMSK